MKAKTETKNQEVPKQSVLLWSSSIIVPQSAFIKATNLNRSILDQRFSKI